MKKSKHSICIVDDNRSILNTLKILLQQYFETIHTFTSPDQFYSHSLQNRVDLVLLDMNFTTGINNGNEGIYWLTKTLSSQPECRVILMTAYGEIELAVKGIKLGAYDFITKPWDNSKLLHVISEAVENGKKQETKKKDNHSDHLLCQSQAMIQLYKQIEKAAVTNANILILGENGTGKEVFAQMIHQASLRKNKEMVSVDMGCITENLIESELFGHIKGAFTDAKTDRIGKIQEANNSTLFLDEIGNLPFHQQAKLLSVLQQRHVTKVGENTPQKVDIRLICATNSNLQELIAERRFREDLFYRINTITLTIPPLRERNEDIIPLAAYFQKKYATLYDKELLDLDKTAKEKLLSYHWPGNIRELQHCIERAVIFGEDYLSADDFQIQIDPTIKVGKHLGTLEELERTTIIDAVTLHKGNLSLVAQQLGITRQTLYNKIKKYQINIERI